MSGRFGGRASEKAGARDLAMDASEFRVGDKVHLGFGVKGGAGFYGVVTKIDDRMVKIRNPEGKTYTGPVSRLTSDDR
jgi:small-conductance mechanosensitive channel